MWAVSGPGLVRVFVRITPLRGVISANSVRVWGTAWVVLARFFLGSTFVLGGGSVAGGGGGPSI